MGVYVSELQLLDGALEGQILHRRIADRNDVAGLEQVALHLRGFERHAETMAERVEPAVFPGERAAHAGIGGIARAEGVTVAPALVGVDVDRHGMCLVIRILRQHLEVGEVLRIVKSELGAQDLCQIEVIAFVVAQVTPHERVPDGGLLDGGRTEAIALTGLHLQCHVGRVVLWIHDELVASQFRVEITVSGGGPLQVAFDRLVRGVTQPVAGSAAGDCAVMRSNSGSVASPGHPPARRSCRRAQAVPGSMSMVTCHSPWPRSFTSDSTRGS